MWYKLNRIMMWVNGVEKQVRPTIVLPYLCFTAKQANSTVQLTKVWSPTAVSLETSTDWNTWSDYTIWDTITLSAVWDKVYMRNKSETPTVFGESSSKFYKFVMTWQIAGSWDINYLLCKESTDTLQSGYCFYYLFQNCASLTSAPALPATTITRYCYMKMFEWTSITVAPELPATDLTNCDVCYGQMFRGCTSLITAPSLPATNVANSCYSAMFYMCTSLTQIPALPATYLISGCYNELVRGCSLIKVSTTQDSDYTQAYRVPTTWTWTTSGSNQTKNMFTDTWWTFTGTPSINMTYYVHKDNVIV